MKKIINDPAQYTDDMLKGIYAAHGDQVKYAEGDLRCYCTANKKPGKVAIITGGGTGHLPLFLGYVGENLLDGCAVGSVFQSPSAEQMLAVTKAIDQGAGVLYIYGNYNGDIFNFDMAAEMADMEEDIRVESVVAGEDVASAAPSAEGEPNHRRGVAGIFFVYKCAGAAAAAGLTLDEVKRVALKACANVRTMGVALTSCTVPRVGHPSFEIGEDEMEIGMGIHGEPGIRRGKLLGRPPGQRHPAQPAAADGAGAGLGQLLRQRQPLGRKGKIRTVHGLVPSRYSVVKAGSYSLLRA